MPKTSGSSGPTITKSIEYFKTAFLIPSKSETFNFKFIAQFAVPPLPGAA